MTKQEIRDTAERLNITTLAAIRYLITGTTANAMFKPSIMRRIDREWKKYRGIKR